MVNFLLFFLLGLVLTIYFGINFILVGIQNSKLRKQAWYYNVYMFFFGLPHLLVAELLAPPRDNQKVK